MPNISSVSPEGFVAFIDVQTAEEIVQVAATSYNPVGIVGEMVAVAHGITVALEATGAADSIAVLNIAVPPTADKTLPASVRIGLSTPSVTVANTIDFSIQYVYLAQGSSTIGASEGEVHCICNPSAVANGYQFAAFDLPAPGVDARVIEFRITRYGSTDTETAVANILGTIAAFTPIKEG